MSALAGWLFAFLFTEAIEVPLYTLALAPRRPLLAALGLAALASLLTHPVVWFLFPRLVPEPFWLMAVLAESFAVLAEAAYLRALHVRRPLLLSLAANGASCGAGLLSSALLGWP